MLRRLEKYELLEEIGHGGMATVYRARDTRLERQVAIKVLHPHLQKAPEARVRFTREAKSVARLKHDNILEIYDYSGEESDESFIAAELLTGPTLKQHIERRGAPMLAEIAACATIAIASALEEAHAKGIVHRDVKPENVLIHEARCVKLTDFGIAQMVDSQSFTLTGQILGSPGHMAPEQVEGECDERTDLFSLGTVLYYLAVGRLPFVGRNPHQVLRRVMETEFADPLRLEPTIGGPIRDAILDCMRRDPGDRFQSAGDLISRLTEIVADMGIDDPQRALASYLSDPDGAYEANVSRFVPRLIERGKDANARGDVAAALDHFNRVLAFDDGNTEVLSLIEQVGRGTRTSWVVAGALLSALGVSAIGIAGWSSSQPPPLASMSPLGSQVNVAIGESAAGGSALGEGALGEGATPENVAGAVGENAVGDDRVGENAASENAANENAASESASENAAGDEATVEDEPTDVPEVRLARVAPTRMVRERATGPRRVLFSPTPANVSIGIDGAAPRPYGPAFSEVTLAPGPHTFRIVGAADCCVDLQERVVIPAGAEPFTLRRRLQFRAARLYVIPNTPGAAVVVNRGRAGGGSGRAREIFEVPMGLVSEIREITVTAPGYADYTGRVRLQAGQVTQQRVTLMASSGGETEESEEDPTREQTETRSNEVERSAGDAPVQPPVEEAEAT